MTSDKTMSKHERLMAGWHADFSEAYVDWLVGKNPREPAEQPPLSPVSVTGYLNGYNRCRRIAYELGHNVDAGSDVASIWTPAAVRAVHDRMVQSKYSPLTIRISLISLDRFLCAVEPKLDRSIVARLLKYIPRRGNVRRKSERLQDSKDLFEIGVALMDETLARTNFDKAAAIAYRIGFQIALLSLRPYRLSVFTNIRHLPANERIPGPGTFLTPENGRYYLNHRPYEAHGLMRLRQRRWSTMQTTTSPQEAAGKPARRMKGGKHAPRRLPVPDKLTSYVNIYLKRVLVVLDPMRSTDYLWLSVHSTPLSKLQTYKDVCAHTVDDNHRSLCPQLMRDCYVTSLSQRSPGIEFRAHETLGNSARMSSERYELPDRERSLNVGHQVAAIMEFYLRPLPTDE